ncbi:MAG: hypothetical protein ACYCYI_01810 [Saccharofermentanales bacterium]
MHKKIIVLFSLLMIFTNIASGCRTSDGQSTLDQAMVKLKKTPENYSYTTEAITIGSIETTKNFTTYFKNETDENGAMFMVKIFLVNDDKSNLFKKDESGIVSIEIRSGIKMDEIRIVEMEGIISEIKNTNEKMRQVTVKITGNHDEIMINNRSRATFKVVTSKKDNLLKVPLKAIKYYDKIPVVGIFKNKVRSDRIISIGYIGEDYAQVLSGLSAGEIVITGTNAIN